MKSIFPTTLSLYLVKYYLLNFSFVLIGLLSVIYLFDTVELLRRAAKVDNVPLTLTLKMGLYKLPEVGQMIFPFAVLFSAMFTFWQLARRHELIIIRSSGLSVWQLIAPIVLVAMLIGVINVTLLNPVGTLFISKYESLETEYLEKRSSLIKLSDQGLWLRQDHDNGKAILHSAKVKTSEWLLNNVVVFFFSQENDFLRRIDASSAKLETGQWKFSDAVVNMPARAPEKTDFLIMATDLTTTDLANSFSTPETVSFWKLPEFIEVLEETGFDSTSLRIYFQSLLSQPLLFMAMVLLAASVSLRPPRLRGTTVLIMSGVIIGFAVFFASSFLQALGASQQIPIIIAAWFPAVICLISGVGALMVLEDG